MRKVAIWVQFDQIKWEILKIKGFDKRDEKKLWDDRSFDREGKEDILWKYGIWWDQMRWKRKDEMGYNDLKPKKDKRKDEEKKYVDKNRW